MWSFLEDCFQITFFRADVFALVVFLVTESEQRFLRVPRPIFITANSTFKLIMTSSKIFWTVLAIFGGMPLSFLMDFLSYQ